MRFKVTIQVGATSFTLEVFGCDAEGVVRDLSALYPTADDIFVTEEL